MSIAVSAVVRPSRLLFTALLAMSIMVVAIGFSVALGLIGELQLALRLPLSAFSLFLGCFGFYHGIRYRKTLHIDISGSGQIRLSDTACDRTCATANRPHVARQGETVRLLNQSTIWPHLLLLHLQEKNGKVLIIPILPDCVSRDSFRALSLACRWVAARESTGNGKKI